VLEVYKDVTREHVNGENANIKMWEKEKKEKKKERKEESKKEIEREKEKKELRGNCAYIDII